MKNSTPFLDNPTFSTVLTFDKKTNCAYIKLDNSESVKCECSKNSNKATIAIDLYTRECNHKLAPEAQQRLCDKHKTYIQEHFIKTSVTEPIQCTFSDTVIYFDVQPQDAEEWFQMILTTLNDDSNLKKR